MFERYSERARRTIFFARYEASQFGSSYIESEHLLLGILREDPSLVELLRIPSSEGLRRKIEERLGPARQQISTSVDLPLTPECQRALQYAAKEAEDLGHKHIETWHLVLGMLRNRKSGASELLGENGIDHHKFLEIVRRMPKQSKIGEPVPTPSSSMPGEESKPQIREPAAAFLRLPLIRLESLLDTARARLEALSNSDGAVRLKRKEWSRRQAMGHLLDWGTAHHNWIARALTEPKVTAWGYPLDEWASAQQYDSMPLERLVALWLAQNYLLLHVMTMVPEARLKTPFRIGIEEPTTLLRVIERYVEHCEDLVAQVLVRS